MIQIRGTFSDGDNGSSFQDGDDVKLNDFDYLLQLPGEERERKWIQARLETLTAQENILLTAAVLKEPPQNTVDAVNQLNSLQVRITSVKRSYGLPAA